MGVMQRLRDLDARGGGIMAPVSGETRTDFLRRLTKTRGLVGPSVSALAQELLDQRAEIAAMKARLEALEDRA
ncbi:MAG: hypothetical protein NVS3B26_04400 [Mycobacteriales bacterium]